MGTPLTGIKYDQNKPRCDLLPPLALLAEARVLSQGAIKYSANNWRNVTPFHDRYTAAALRHLLAYMSGEKTDPETKESHLAHAACCIHFMLQIDEETNLTPTPSTQEVSHG